METLKNIAQAAVVTARRKRLEMAYEAGVSWEMVEEQQEQIILAALEAAYALGQRHSLVSHMLASYL